MFQKCNISLYLSSLLVLISFLWISTAYPNQIRISEPSHCMMSKADSDSCTEANCCDNRTDCGDNCMNINCNTTTHFSFIAPVIIIPENIKEITLKQKTDFPRLFYSSFYHTIWQPPKIV